MTSMTSAPRARIIGELYESRILRFGDSVLVEVIEQSKT